MPKFGKVYEHLVRDGVATFDQFHIPEPASIDALRLVHTATYVDAYLQGTLDQRAMRRIGLPWSKELVARTRTAVGGTILTAQLAMSHGLACNTAGGTHHAHADFGSGFCIFNDIAVAARMMQQLGLAHKILVIDLDVHQGDGTAAIFQNDPSVFTFSLHCGANFPFRKTPGDLDLALAVGTGDEEYLKTLSQTIPLLLREVAPDLVFYDAGVDPHVEDALGKLTVSDHGLWHRDHFVLHSCLTAGVPVAAVIGGGYQKNVDKLAQRHSTVHRVATELYEAFSLISYAQRFPVKTQ